MCTLRPTQTGTRTLLSLPPLPPPPPPFLPAPFSIGDQAFADAMENGSDEAFTVIVLVAFSILCTLVMTK